MGLKPITPRQAAARAQNGKLGGRPPKRADAQAARSLKLARELGKAATRPNVEFLIQVRDGLIMGASVRDRIEAANSLLDRFGDCPRAAQTTLAGEALPVKLVDLTGWAAPEANGEGNGAAH